MASPTSVNSIGTNKSYLVDVEYGRKSPTLDTIERIARGLDVTISYLVKDIDTDEEGDKTSPDSSSR